MAHQHNIKKKLYIFHMYVLQNILLTFDDILWTIERLLLKGQSYQILDSILDSVKLFQCFLQDC
jgi:hypothetical protein